MIKRGQELSLRQEMGQLLEEKVGQRKVDVFEKEYLKGKEPNREGEVGSHRIIKEVQ